MLRTSVSAAQLDSADVVRAYKSLANVERAFRRLKSVDLQIRPLHHWSEDRVRAHVLLCMLAYYVQWHMERAWAPLLFRDEQPAPAEHPVAPARRSAAALRKVQTQRLEDGGTPRCSVALSSCCKSHLARCSQNRAVTPRSAELAQLVKLPSLDCSTCQCCHRRMIREGAQALARS